ncbi:MAG TPA: hypothetical protein VF458_23790, partial [Ktedonobacteraceae bacterium]
MPTSPINITHCWRRGVLMSMGVSSADFLWPASFRPRVCWVMFSNSCRRAISSSRPTSGLCWVRPMYMCE